MFLKVLYEHTTETGLYSDRSSNYIDVLRDTMVDFFGISYLTDEEFEEGALAVRELEYYGYIQTNIDEETENFKELTENGKRIARKNIDDIVLPNLNISSVLTRYDLRELVLDEYLNGDYNVALKKAFTMLELKVRENIVRPSVLLEKEQASNFFVSEEGLIRENKNEEMTKRLKTLHFKFLGDIMWYNSASTPLDDEESAIITAQILGFVNLHLKLVEQCTQIM
ncbi:MAG: hypothetical protein K8H86_06170 [Ignavibacteriaceae bacterium]|nr:hypothetical protein [Ignavibacteriaceae bacterium]